MAKAHRLTPETIAECENSYTGRYSRKIYHDVPKTDFSLRSK